MPDSQVSYEDDATLIQRAKSGDSFAFGVLYERYANDIYRFIRAQIPDDLEAEDLTATVFLKAWGALERYREQGFPFSSFLYRIARTTLVDRWRKQKKEIPTSEYPLEDVGDEFASVQGNPQARFEAQVLMQVLQKLPEDYRIVLVYRFINALSPREIAGLMGKSEGAVRVTQYRALRAARELLVEAGVKHESET